MKKTSTLLLNTLSWLMQISLKINENVRILQLSSKQSRNPQQTWNFKMFILKPRNIQITARDIFLYIRPLRTCILRTLNKTNTGHTQNNGAVSSLKPLILHHSLVYALYMSHPNTVLMFVFVANRRYMKI
jgi:hypothetical protein